jgi:GR25 family glycosyltransferase involved in LPS biosynthesis
MILIQQISSLDLEYVDDIKECLKHNVLNPIIETIVVFSNCRDFERKVKVESRKIKYFEVEIDLFEMMRYGQKNSKNYIIYSTPFLKFGTDLKKAMNFDVEKVLKEENCYYIFDKRLDIKNDRNIENILAAQKLVNSLNLQKMGYYIKGFQYNSYDWRVSRAYKDKKNKIEEKAKIVHPVISNDRVEETVDERPSIRVGAKKLDVVIVSVNYNDFLLVSLEKNVKMFDSITVVTSSSDFLCQMICEKFGVKCVVTDVMYDNNAVFNKGKAINEGIRSILNPDFILLLDADIVVMNKVDLDSLEDSLLYTSERHIVPNYDSYKRYISGDNKIFKVEKDQGFGFFQLFKYSKVMKYYPESFGNAAGSDIKFRDKFKERKNIGKTVLHLGTDSNWDGRKSKIFLNYDEFMFLLEKKPFDVNSYFDRIYCLNLDRREDRWKAVDQIFKKNGIDVERFSAIDGQHIHDLEFSDTGLSEDQCSNEGLIENKNSLACLLSHLEIIKNAKENGYARILIFEDDVIFSKSFKEDISNIESYDWKLLYLGASQFNWENIEISNNHYKCRKTLGTFAYAIDSSIYDDIIDGLEKREKSIDNMLSDIQRKYKKSSFVVYPNIVISDVSDSDIRKSKDKIDYAKAVRWDLNMFPKKLKNISIVIPCYNQSEFLIECVDSCLSQTVLPDSILVLLMDEKSIAMKQLLKSRSNIIKCFVSDRKYLSAARNYLISKVQTEYFIPLDADDKIPSNFVEEVSSIDSDVVYVGSKYFGDISGCWPDPITEEVDWTKLTTFRRNSLVCTALIKKDSFIKSGGYNEGLWAFEDMDLWIRMHKNHLDFKKCNATFLSYRKILSKSSLLSQANSDSRNIENLKGEIMKDNFYSKTPKIIHWVWLGKKPVPQEVIDTWYKSLPDSDWKYIMWNEDNFDMESCEFLRMAYRLKKYGICVDYIRAKVLYEFGGIWLDADCVINKDISPFLQWDFFASWENESYLNIGLIGCSPKLDVIKNILDYYTDMKVSEDVLVSNHSFVKEIGTGPIVLTKEIMKIENVINGGFTKNFEHDGKKYLIETPDVFVLDDSESDRINYAVHLFDGSWTDKKEEWSVVVRNSYNSWKIKNGI